MFGECLVQCHVCTARADWFAGTGSQAKKEHLLLVVSGDCWWGIFCIVLGAQVDGMGAWERSGAELVVDLIQGD